MQNPAPNAAASPGEAASARGVALPLTFKGLIACLVLVAYGCAMAVYVLGERQAMLRQIAELDERQALEESLKRAGLAVSNALLALRQLTPADDPAQAARDTTPFALEAVEGALGARRARLPAVFAQHRQVERRLEALVAQPSRASLLELRESLEVLGREVEGEGAREREQRTRTAREFHQHGDRIALISLGLGLGGLIVFGAVTALFFTRLAVDLGALGVRARAIVAGYRGEPLEITRRDEVGSLARDVNRLAADLSTRERELALARELRAHREKMAALGAVARNLSHEIGNPLATISALAQDAATRQDGAARGAWQPDLILQQTRRIAEITRQIADFSGPRAGTPEPVDVGAMLGTVCEFMGFDPRYHATRIELKVAPDLAPLVVVPDELSEVLMNLIESALEAQTGCVVVEAAAGEGCVAIRVPGSATPGDVARRERTLQLVESMKGRMRVAREGLIEVVLPTADLAVS